MTPQQNPKEERTSPELPPKPYSKPAIIYEGKLETRAGSPLSIPNPLDPLGLEPKE